MKKIIAEKRTFFLFILIVFLAGLFRLSNLDLIEFKHDEALNLYLASRPFFGYDLPYGGTASSLGILNPPLFNYFLLPFTFLTRDPVFHTFIIAIANVISIGFIFLFLKKYYGLLTSFIASSVLALSPWAVLFSRKIWMQDLILPFSALLVFSLHKMLIDKEKGYSFLLSFSSLVLIQLHPTSVLFVAPIFLFLLFKKVSLNWRNLFLGALAGGVFLIPYVIYQISNGCPDCFNLFATGEKLQERSFSIFLRPLQILSQGNFSTILGSDTLTFSNEYPFSFQARIFFYLEYLLIPVGGFLFFMKNRKIGFVFFALVLLPLLYFLLEVETHIHYFIILLPLLSLFLALPISFLLKNKNILIKTSGAFIFLGIIFTSSLFNNSFYSLIREKGGLEGDYGGTYVKNEAKFLKNPNLSEKENEEAFLFSFVQARDMFGYTPVPRMIFRDYSEERIGELEDRLAKDPENRRLTLELLAIYTKDEPTKEIVLILEKKKGEDRPYYQEIYTLAKERYLSLNHKKEHFSENLGVTFQFPEHLKVQEEPGKIQLSSEEYEVTVINQRPANGEYLNTQKGNIFVSFEKKNDKINDSDLENIAKEITESIM